MTPDMARPNGAKKCSRAVPVHYVGTCRLQLLPGHFRAGAGLASLSSSLETGLWWVGEVVRRKPGGGYLVWVRWGMFRPSEWAASQSSTPGSQDAKGRPEVPGLLHFLR